jgi:hypothetical protein
MVYSMITMRHSLKILGVSKGVNPFLWEKEGTKGLVNPVLSDQFKVGQDKSTRGQNFLNDLLEYCWLVYSKAFSASGVQLIGRTGDLWVSEQLKLVGISDTDKQTLWDPHTKGNIQVMDKWSPAVNDCWVLGGVHRRADFELVSIRNLKNLWDFSKNLPVVTAREILGLLHFGYKLEQQPARLCLVCKNPADAQGATIEDYNDFMVEMQAKGADSIRSILVMDPALQNEIQSFDKSRLRHVTPPR